MMDALRRQFSLLPKGTNQFVLRNINFNHFGLDSPLLAA